MQFIPFPPGSVSLYTRSEQEIEQRQVGWIFSLANQQNNKTRVIDDMPFRNQIQKENWGISVEGTNHAAQSCIIQILFYHENTET